MTRASEEHAMFRASLSSFVEQEVKPHVQAWEAEGAVPRHLFRSLGEQGFLGIRFPEELGGSALDFSYTAILIEELVRAGSLGVAVSVLVHAEFATKVLDDHGSAQLKETFLRPAIQGELIGALGLTEPDTGSDVGGIRTVAVRKGDDYVINGAKTFITNGNLADFVTTAVRTGEPGHRGISLIVIPQDAPGFLRGRRLRKVGLHASDTAELSFEDCKVPATHLVGEENQGFKQIMRGFVGERLVLAIMCCAHMRLMWEEARRYGHERRAFGEPLLGFQVWQHRLADALTTIEAAEALTQRTLDRSLAGEDCSADSSMAKLFASEASRTIAHECAQIFGGNGFMDEYLVARMRRDSLAFTIGAGTSEVMREIVARSNGLVPGARTRDRVENRPGD